MFSYTKHNYFQWGYREAEPFSLPPADSNQVKLWFEVDTDQKIIPENLSIRESTLISASEILDQADQVGMPPTLFLSGGIDSEAMLYAFLEVSGRTRPFSCISVELEHGLNGHELEVARRLCQRHSVKHEIIQIDPFKLWYRLPKHLQEHRLDSGILYVILEALEAFPNRFQIVGGNPVFRVDNIWNPTRLELEVGSAVLCHMRHWIMHDRPGVALFHQYSPQQYYGWINHPLVQAWEKQLRGSAIWDFNGLKALIYQIEFPEISENRKKWTGEEHLKKHIDDLWLNQWSSFRPFNPRFRRSRIEVLSELAFAVE